MRCPRRFAAQPAKINSTETVRQTAKSPAALVATPVCTPDLIVVPTVKNGPVVGVKPEATGMIRAGGKYERWRLKRGTPDVPCPLVHDGLVYLCREMGGLTILDAKTGEVVAQR